MKANKILEELLVRMDKEPVGKGDAIAEIKKAIAELTVVCDFCGTVNDAHHSAECIDRRRIIPGIQWIHKRDGLPEKLDYYLVFNDKVYITWWNGKFFDHREIDKPVPHWASINKPSENRKKIEITEGQDKISIIINLLSELSAKDLDEQSVQGLCQFHFWLQQWTGSIFVKTVGRIAGDR